MNRTAVIVFAKNPISGRVKTRLASKIGDDAAARLYRAFLIDTLEKCRRLEATVRLYLSPTGDRIDSAIAPYDKLALRQRGHGLGQRMNNAISDTFAEGFNRIAVIGSDHPTIPLRYLEEAFASLEESNTVVVGPTRDGGYYLLGLSTPQPALFEHMTYSHADVFEQTVSRAQKAGLRLKTLGQWYDVDTIDDVRRLSRDVLNGESECPNTRRAMIAAGLIENAR